MLGKLRFSNDFYYLFYLWWNVEFKCGWRNNEGCSAGPIIGECVFDWYCKQGYVRINSVCASRSNNCKANEDDKDDVDDDDKTTQKPCPENEELRIDNDCYEMCPSN